VTKISKPDGFCDEAWKTISHYEFALSQGHTEPFFGGSWIENHEVAITCCNDEIRPVVLKRETENEKINNCLCKQKITGDSKECYRTRHYHSKLNTSHPI
ncbi:TIGR04076 family protein, partial [Anaerostipes hadrus]|uniref:TIGR04076 family protein n=1 Tax=Anaerostipes hadrus TaxID=649756 RepID=UPI001ADD9AF3